MCSRTAFTVCTSIAKQIVVVDLLTRQKDQSLTTRVELASWQTGPKVSLTAFHFTTAKNARTHSHLYKSHFRD